MCIPTLLRDVHTACTDKLPLADEAFTFGFHNRRHLLANEVFPPPNIPLTAMFVLQAL